MMDIHYVNEIDCLHMVSVSEGWAISGLGPDGSTTLVHYVNGEWEVDSRWENVKLNDIEMVSANEGWAVGEIYPNGQGVILHYKNRKWSKVEGVKANALRSVTMVSSTDGWAISTDDIYLRSTLLRCQDGIWTNYT